MVKKLKIICTVFVLIAVVTIIPIAISAAQKTTFNMSNIVRFSVQDLQGKFFYGITGNAEDLETGLDHNIGTIDENNHLETKLLFKGMAYQEHDGSKYDGKFVVYDGTNKIVESGEIAVPDNGLKMDQYHQTIDYYFVFVNQAENQQNVVGEDRSVKIIATATISSDGLKGDEISGSWQAATATVSEEGLNNVNYIDYQNIAWNSSLSLGTGVDVGAKNANGTYNYIVLNYKLNVEDTFDSFSTPISLTITLKSNNV